MPENILVTLIAYCFLGTSVAAGQAKDLATECQQTKEKIRAVRSKMRSGYTRAQGEKLEAKLRKPRAKRKKLCR
jgi:hypothetical protein